MAQLRSLRLATPAALLAVAMASAPVSAAAPVFRPSVRMAPDTSNDSLLTDLASRGSQVAATIDAVVSGTRRVDLLWSTDSGATWDRDRTDEVARESETLVCAGRAVAVYTAPVNASTRLIKSHHNDLHDPIEGGREWSSSGLARSPDAACVANTEMAVAWFRKTDDGWRVRLRVGVVSGDDMSSQTFDLGRGTPSRDLAVASSSTRVYVAWFRGRSLKVRRFAIGAAPDRTLTSLGTTTVADLRYGYTPEIGADRSRVVLAYQDRADLKVRRSTDKGASFGAARTLRDEPFPSEIGAFPTTVAVRGDRVAIGAVELGGVEELVGKGLGYKSTNGGLSYSLVSKHTSGRTVATLVKPGSVWRYAEAWDESITNPTTERLRYRRQ